MSKYTRLIGRANKELSRFHALKYKNWHAAENHRRMAYALFEQARVLLEKGLHKP
jgi:hypothetical protein